MIWKKDTAVHMTRKLEAAKSMKQVYTYLGSDSWMMGTLDFRSCGDVQVQLETVAVVATVTQQRRVLVWIGSAQTINCR